ncbi:MAG TPA: dihydrolipoamide acetyltransferase family protein [Solirubrobacterales bacterium]|nr:dihydrolipoamide acetyltransferase family protein [Solirubrobacterales bacterium]
MSIAIATEVLMPKLSDSMEEGTILSWLVPPGTEIVAGQDLLEVETDKANMTVAAEGSGALEILIEEGETVAVGIPIARLGSEGASAAAAESPTAAAAAEVPVPIPPSADESPVASSAVSVSGATRRSTPLARRLAEAHGIVIDSIETGSGIGGRVVKADVLIAAGMEPKSAVDTTPAPAPSRASEGTGVGAAATVETAKGGSRTVELSRLQTVIARRMAEAKATVPHFQVETEVRMDAAIDLRTQLKAVPGDDPAPSFNDMIIKAAALALREHPKANGSYVGGAFELHDRVNVGMAVAAEDALVVPTIFDADKKSLGEIGRDSRRLAGRVRAGAVTPPELAGGTFTVSNLGMFGMTAIYPVINPPQAAILGVGKTRSLLGLGADGEIEDVSLMTLTLSCDHRILYGAEAAEFLAAIRDLLESPLRVAL